MATPTPRPRRDVTDSVLHGAPRSMRQDIYFSLIETSWGRLLLLVFCGYVGSNLLFGLLYWLVPNSIAGMHDGSFSDCFFFSIQTMSTIGYGAMHPVGQYAHILVTIQSAIAVLGLAMTTGLVFAKAARPHSMVVFSQNLVVTQDHGRPVLMFRAGNARGNEVVEATMRVAVVKDETSPEGHHMRRLYDLKLVRDRSPLFSLTWMVMHHIDENSPLAGCIDDGELDPSITVVIATLTGHDASYGQTTHARTVWYPEDVRIGHHFADIMSDLPDGRLMVDYTRFDELKPDGERA